MKIRLEINPKYTETEIHVCDKAETYEAKNTYRTLINLFDTTLMAHNDNEIIPIKSNDIIRIYSQSKKVFAQTERGCLKINERLYELEEKLDNSGFLRISNSEIVNLKKVERLDTGTTGTIKMYLAGDECTYVSRRYVSKIKKALGI